MKATEIEFRYRGIWIGVIFWAAFSLYFVDHRNLGALIVNSIASRTGYSEDVLVHLVFAAAATIVVLSALLRTWAASYLTKDIVHDAQMHSELLVADGPYRYVRNPLYLAVDLFAVGMSVMVSPLGAVGIIV